jgi:hypothetical protein
MQDMQGMQDMQDVQAVQAVNDVKYAHKCLKMQRVYRKLGYVSTFCVLGKAVHRSGELLAVSALMKSQNHSVTTADSGVQKNRKCATDRPLRKCSPD